VAGHDIVLIHLGPASWRRRFGGCDLQGTYPIVVWALAEDDDDGSRDVIGLAVAGGKALIAPDPGTFERYTQTG
jgi:hypothetical protein